MDEVSDVKCVEFDSDTLEECLNKMSLWASDHPQGDVNVWAVNGPHFNRQIHHWYAEIYYKDLCTSTNL